MKVKTSHKINNLASLYYHTLNAVNGPLLVVECQHPVTFGELVEIQVGNDLRYGQVLEINNNLAVVQVFEGTSGLGANNIKVKFTAEVPSIYVSLEMLGRIFNGRGEPIDGKPQLITPEKLPVAGLPINPFAREQPSDFIQTGISAIDALNTLVRGQKLPIFSGPGLPANELCAQIIKQAKVRSEEKFAIVFAAMGITFREAAFFKEEFEKSGSLNPVVFFLNLADDPTIERLLTPRCALTAAEYLAFKQQMHVLVILTDMTNYCEALREVSTSREEVPGRRGYPGYMYTDLATIYERAGRVKESKGSITQLIILTMPDDDITHPIPDLTGYITEGQIVLSRELHRQGIFPPIDVLPCLSRLMNLGIGEGKTREDHRRLADQLYSSYAEGKDVRRLVAIIGEDALSEREKAYLKFADKFEKEFVNQGQVDRDINKTFTLAWELLATLPPEELKRVTPEQIKKYLPHGRDKDH